MILEKQTLIIQRLLITFLSGKKKCLKNKDCSKWGFGILQTFLATESFYFLFMRKHFCSLPLNHSAGREQHSRFRDMFFLTLKLYLLPFHWAFQTSTQTFMFGSVFSHFILCCCHHTMSVPAVLGTAYCVLGLLSWSVQLARIQFRLIGLICTQWLV